ncbi:MAG: hypothetical protein GX682_02485 [Clostridiaceae bacterium]|nr:hypothetical protein [Clostridiaceae bacterium]
MKKYRIKKRRKAIKVNTIFFVILILLIAISIGYSFYSISLNINGNVKVETGKSIAYWKKISQWDNEGIYYYQIELTVNNLDGNISNWDLAIDVPPYLSQANTQAWGSSENTVDEYNSFDRLNMKSYGWNGTVANEGNLQQTIIFAFTQNVDFKLLHVFLNDKLTKKIVELKDGENLEEKIEGNKDPEENVISNVVNSVENNQNTSGEIIPDEPIPENSNSETTWKITNEWINNTEYGCAIELKINNLDGNISNWTISLDVPLSLNKDSIDAWGSSSTTVEEHNTFYRVTITSYSWNGTVANGAELTQSLNLRFTDPDVNFNIYNILFNGKKIIEPTKTT